MKTWAPEVSHIWDANEQVAEMFLIRNSEGDLQNSLASFEVALAVYPFRYNSLAGAARCADLLGDDIKASKYYGDLLTLVKGPFPNVYLLGMYNSTCADYDLERRPDIILATEYFEKSSFDSSDSSEKDELSTLTIFLYTFVPSVMLVIGYFVGAVLHPRCTCLHSRKDGANDMAYSPLANDNKLILS